LKVVVTEFVVTSPDHVPGVARITFVEGPSIRKLVSPCLDAPFVGDEHEPAVFAQLMVTSTSETKQPFGKSPCVKETVAKEEYP
jgi:hypothetical protein